MAHLNWYLINFIENVDARYIHAIAFNDVNQFLGHGVMSQCDVSIADSVLAKYSFHSVNVQLRLTHLITTTVTVEYTVSAGRTTTRNLAIANRSHIGMQQLTVHKVNNSNCHGKHKFQGGKVFHEWIVFSRGGNICDTLCGSCYTAAAIAASINFTEGWVG